MYVGGGGGLKIIDNFTDMEACMIKRKMMLIQSILTYVIMVALPKKFTFFS